MTWSLSQFERLWKWWTYSCCSLSLYIHSPHRSESQHFLLIATKMLFYVVQWKHFFCKTVKWTNSSHKYRDFQPLNCNNILLHLSWYETNLLEIMFAFQSKKAVLKCWIITNPKNVNRIKLTKCKYLHLGWANSIWPQVFTISAYPTQF